MRPKKIRRLADLFSKPSRWVQGESAIGRNGGTHSLDRRACAWCFWGGVVKVYPTRFYAAISFFMRSYYGVCGPSIIGWNDDPARTFEEIQVVAIKVDAWVDAGMPGWIPGGKV